MNGNKARSICIIPARGGSKRIPKKNIKFFHGFPILHWSISCALKSKLFDVVMVSTDDEEIAKISLKSGAEVPFVRSKVSSGDFSTTSEVLIEVLNCYFELGEIFTTCCCLYPTAVLTSTEDLISGKSFLENNNYNAVFPVIEFKNNIWRSFTRSPKGKTLLNFKKHMNSRSQDLEKSYFDAGQWYWFEVDKFMNHKNLLNMNCGSIIISNNRAQDIDTEEDWKEAERKFDILKTH